MKEHLFREFGVFFVIFCIILVCITAAAAFAALREPLQAGKETPGSRVLEIIWIIMPLSLLIALACAWLIFPAEPGFASKYQQNESKYFDIVQQYNTSGSIIPPAKHR